MRLRNICLALLALFGVGAGPAAAATISIVSMHYSAAHPVPHLHYEGDTLAGDVATLQRMYDSFVKCRISCIGPDGGPTAVLTMNGPGGDYYEGLALADFLRANHIATVVERGAGCYSACAFAFLGGSAYSAQEGIGTYIDRMVEPGSIVGFHAPYANEEAFLSALEQRGAMAAQGDTRNSLALMVKELVRWNVDPEVMFYMIGMGPQESYNLLTADDLFLARVALPPTPTSAWITDMPTAIRNACTRLLAIFERTDPLEVEDRFLSDYTPGITKTADSAVDGFKLSDRPLDIGSCGVTASTAESGGDFDISLFLTPGFQLINVPGTDQYEIGFGYSGSVLTMFNRQDGWSTVGIGGNPVKRIFQKGGMNSYFLPMRVKIDDLDLPGEMLIDLNRFNTVISPLFPVLPNDAVIDAELPGARVSHIGNVFIFERSGPALLYESAFALEGLGRDFTNNAGNEAGFIREGTYSDTGAAFSWFGFRAGEQSVVVEAFVVKPDNEPATAEEKATLRRIHCSYEFQGLKLGCAN